MRNKPDAVLLGLSETLRIRNCKRSQHYLDISRGVMTPGIVKGRRKVSWPAHEVDAINAAEIAGATRAERKALVQYFMDERKQERQALLSMLMQPRPHAKAAAA